MSKNPSKSWRSPSAEVIDRVAESIRWDGQGLVPAIAQCADSGEVLMMAWMNADSLRLTLREGQVTYWSRSRQALWRKGDTSGHRQALISFHYDCDGDTVLMQVRQTGPACHTNRRSCFYSEVTADGVVVKE